jgi:subtilase family serine protease
MTAEEVIEKFAPSNESVEAVTAWLISSGISGERITHTDNKAWLAITMTVAETENLLQTEFYEYRHMNMNHTTVACDEYVPTSDSPRINSLRLTLDKIQTAYSPPKTYRLCYTRCQVIYLSRATTH